MHMQVDARSDVYSLGVVFFACLTGVLPFNGTSVEQIVHLHMTAMPPKMPSHVPEYLQRVVAKMLRKMPEERYQSMDSIYRVLQYFEEHPLAIEPPELQEPSTVLTFPLQLVGREHELSILHKASLQTLQESKAVMVRIQYKITL